MTETTQKGRHGGARRGAGRPKKSVSILAESEIAEAMAKPVPESAAAEIRRHVAGTFAEIVRLATYSKVERVVVACCCEILDRGWGKPGAGIGAEELMLPFARKPDQAPVEITAEAQRLTHFAIATLNRIASTSANDRIRAAASLALVERGVGRAPIAKVPDELAGLRKLGKKEQANRAADAAAVGRYAPPAPPRGIVSNGA